MLHHLIADATAKALQYHVDPKIFVVLYALHYAILWPSVAWILVLFRKGRDIGNWVSFAVFVLISPWFYPLFFGRLPWYFDAVLVVVMIAIAVHFYHDIQKKLAHEREKMSAAQVARQPD